MYFWPFVLLLTSVCSAHLPIYWLDYLFFWCWLFEFVIYSGYLSHVRWIAGKDFLLFCRLSLHTGKCFLCCAVLFILMWSHLSFLATIS
jgi:hypothetical protein